MTAPKPVLIKLADEAEFQLEVARNHLEWVSAIARAIARDAQFGGHDIKALSQLAKHLDDTGMTNVDFAIDNFRKILAEGAEVSS
ncbi:hypothetical protein [Pseudomonas bohemica]|uniref:hypothetical protein n=1 Tax=Pseudomonas bohemica TaxID=2044872 RepID=UPI000DA6072A|nr:hypothetical protein [Pseudomonas bohemica]